MDDSTKQILTAAGSVVTAFAGIISWIVKGHIDRDKKTEERVQALEVEQSSIKTQLLAGAQRFDRLEAKLDKHDEKLGEVRAEITAGFQHVTELMLERRDRKRSDDP